MCESIIAYLCKSLFCFVFIIKDLLEMKFIYNNRFYEISHIFHDNFTNIKPLYILQTYINIFIFCSDIKYLCNKCAMLPFDVSVLPSECHHFNLLHSLSSWKPWYARIEEIWFVWHAHCVWNKNVCVSFRKMSRIK